MARNFRRQHPRRRNACRRPGLFRTALREAAHRVHEQGSSSPRHIPASFFVADGHAPPYSALSLRQRRRIMGTKVCRPGLRAAASSTCLPRNARAIETARALPCDAVIPPGGRRRAGRRTRPTALPRSGGVFAGGSLSCGSWPLYPWAKPIWRGAQVSRTPSGSKVADASDLEPTTALWPLLPNNPLGDDREPGGRSSSQDSPSRRSHAAVGRLRRGQTSPMRCVRATRRAPLPPRCP